MLTPQLAAPLTSRFEKVREERGEQGERTADRCANEGCVEGVHDVQTPRAFCCPRVLLPVRWVEQSSSRDAVLDREEGVPDPCWHEQRALRAGQMNLFGEDDSAD
jgi:hypothetical protein